MWFTLNVTVAVTLKLFWLCPIPGFAHLGGGGGGVFTFCPVVWFSVMIFLISGSTGDVVQERLLNVDTFWWKFVMDVLTEENLVLDNSITVDFEVSAVVFDSKLTFVSWTGLRTLLSTLCTTGEGQRTLWTKLGEISFWDSLSLGEVFSFFRSRGSLKVVRFKVFGGVGRGCRGSDDANVVVVKAPVGDELPAHENKTTNDYFWACGQFLFSFVGYLVVGDSLGARWKENYGYWRIKRDWDCDISWFWYLVATYPARGKENYGCWRIVRD